MLRTELLEHVLALRLHFLGAGLQVLVRLAGKQLHRHVQIAANDLIDDAKLIRLVDTARIKHAADLEKVAAQLDEVNAWINVHLAAAEELLALVGV